MFSIIFVRPTDQIRSQDHVNTTLDQLQPVKYAIGYCRNRLGKWHIIYNIKNTVSSN